MSVEELFENDFAMKRAVAMAKPRMLQRLQKAHEAAFAGGLDRKAM